MSYLEKIKELYQQIRSLELENTKLASQLLESEQQNQILEFQCRGESSRSLAVTMAESSAQELQDENSTLVDENHQLLRKLEAIQTLSTPQGS